jgi:hypothetical protein
MRYAVITIMRLFVLFAAFLASVPCRASLIAVDDAPRELRLQVCASGGAISVVSFTVPAASVGNAVAVVGTFAGTCGAGTCPAGVVYLDAEARSYNGGIGGDTATLSVNSAAPLSDGAGNTIPFTQISWIASGFAPISIPSGAFSGSASQVLDTFVTSQRNQQCHAFQYLNDQYFPGGTYNGRVTYTMTMP